MKMDQKFSAKPPICPYTPLGAPPQEPVTGSRPPWSASAPFGFWHILDQHVVQSHLNF